MQTIRKLMSSNKGIMYITWGGVNTYTPNSTNTKTIEDNIQMQTLNWHRENYTHPYMLKKILTIQKMCSVVK